MEQSKKELGRYEDMLSNIPGKKKLVYESDKKGDNLLDPKQIRE